MKVNIETGYDSGHGQAKLAIKERRIGECNTSMSIANHRKNVHNILCDCGKKASFFFFVKSKTIKNYGRWFYRCRECKNKELYCGFFEREDEANGG